MSQAKTPSQGSGSPVEDLAPMRDAELSEEQLEAVAGGAIRGSGCLTPNTTPYIRRFEELTAPEGSQSSGSGGGKGIWSN